MAGRKWTEKEDEYLYESWGTIAIETMAKHLNRTVFAIRKRRESLGLLGYLESGDYITVRKLFSLMRGDNSRNCRRHEVLKNAGCPVFMKKMGGKRPSVMAVRIDEFWAWLKDNPTMFNLAMLEENILGPEPDWVKKKRFIDWKYNFAPIKNTLFTRDEERELVRLAKTYQYTYDEIALRLGRSAQSIKDKMAFMGLPVRLGHLTEPKKWTDEDDRQILSLVKEGFTVRGISLKMGRSEITIRGRMSLKWRTSAVNSLFHMIQRGEIAC